MTELDAQVGEAAKSDARFGPDGLLRYALDMLPGSGAAILDLDGRFLAAFGEALEQGGFTPEHIVGKTLSEVFAPGTIDQMADGFESALKGAESNFELISEDGSKWYQFDMKPIFEGDELVAVFGFATDITARKNAEAQVVQERQFFEDVLDSISHLVTVKSSDRKILYTNRFFEGYTGFKRSDMIGRMFTEFFEPVFGELSARDDTEVLERGEATRSEREVPAADGSSRTFLTDRAPLRREDGTVYGVVTVGVDVSERLAVERDLADAERRFEAAFMNAPNGMALIAIDGRFLRANPALAELTGYSVEELLELKVADIAVAEDMEEQVALVERAMAGEFDSYSLEKRFTRKSGEVIWLILGASLIRDGDGQPLYVIAQSTNISEGKRVEADLRHEAGQDALTDLANRRQIETLIREQLEQTRRTGEAASLLMMDLDGFKEVNDRHGHVAGDALLRFFAGEIKGQVRPVDTPARFGGDEFVVLMKGVDSQRAEIISRQLMDHFEKVVFEPDGLALHCRISVGHAEIDAETEDAAAVLAAADSSMYEVKRARKAVG